MRLLFLENKDKFDKKYILIIFLCMVGFISYFHLFVVGSMGAYLQHFQFVQKSALVAFAGIIFLAFEMFADFQKKNFKELVAIEKRGLLKIVLCKDLILLVMIAMIFATITLIELLLLRRSGDFALLASHVLRVTLLNYFLFPIMAANCGKMFALLCKRRWTGYLGILILILLGFAIFSRINMGLHMTMGMNLDTISKFFQFVQPNAAWEVDYLYLVPAESYRYFMFLFWIFLAETLICLCFYKGKMGKSLCTIVCLAVTVLFAYQVVDSNSYLNYDLNETSAVNAINEFEDDVMAKEKQPEFTVEKYVMDLDISDELNATVKMSLTGKTDEYCFTLYRGYELDNVADEDGNILEYDRELDFITVFAEQEISEIHMTYHGFSHTFYSNSHAVMLPGYFAYYPQAGHRKVFVDENVDSMIYYGFNMDEKLLVPSDYEINVAYSGNVYSNLEGKNGTFSGTTKVPTIIAGLVSEETKPDGHFIYPSLVDPDNISVTELEAKLSYYSELLGLEDGIFSNINHIVVVPNTARVGSCWGSCNLMDDTLFVVSNLCSSGTTMDDLAMDIIDSKLDIRGNKSNLYSVMESYLMDHMYIQDVQPMNEEEFFAVSYNEKDDEDPAYVELWLNLGFERMYGTVVEKYGEEVVLKEAMDYVQDETNQMNIAEFLQNLYLELGEAQ